MVELNIIVQALKIIYCMKLRKKDKLYNFIEVI
jgi:hypothetical protein